MTGKRRQGSESFKGAKKDAEKRLREILGDLDKGVSADAGNLTVGQYLRSP